MRKYQTLYYSLLFLFSFLHSLGYSQKHQTEGLIEYSFSQIHTDSSNAENIVWREWSRIWFKDSCVVYEQRINLETAEQSYGGTIIKKSYPVRRHIYLDLRTMICQDYRTFKDTAMPFCNYFLNTNDTIGFWKFYAPKKPWNIAEKIICMPDTIINHTLFKRIKVLYTGKDYSSIHYLDCKATRNIFHLNRTLDEMFSGKVIRADLLDKNGKVTGRTEYKIVKNKLSTEEKNIFKQWQQNAKKPNLPLLPYSQAIRSCTFYPEHENPSITIEPLKRK